MDLRLWWPDRSPTTTLTPSPRKFWLFPWWRFVFVINVRCFCWLKELCTVTEKQKSGVCGHKCNHGDQRYGVWQPNAASLGLPHRQTAPGQRVSGHNYRRFEVCQFDYSSTVTVNKDSGSCVAISCKRVCVSQAAVVWFWEGGRKERGPEAVAAVRLCDPTDIHGGHQARGREHRHSGQT